MEEYIVLVDENNNVLGTAPKLASHHGNTPLHRAFSVFLFNEQGELLLQQRSHVKKTWPLVWSNSCCGHPTLEETPEQAAHRRLQFELGIRNAQLFMMLPTYRYRCEKDGIVENEICPVLVGKTTEQPVCDPDEVESTRWVAWNEWVKEIKSHPKVYSYWCVEETNLLNAKKEFQDFLHKAIR